MSWRIDLILPLHFTEDVVRERVEEYWYVVMNTPEGWQYTWVYEEPLAVGLRENELKRKFPEGRIKIYG